MKKFLIILVLFIGACAGTLLYNANNKINKEPKTSVIDNTINEIQAKLDDYKQKEQEEKLRKLKLQQLQNPEIIYGEFKKVGKLITYQGTMKYSDMLKDKRWYGSRELNLELKYNYGLAIDINKIIVDRFIEDIVILKIPRKEMRLEYIEFDSENSKINGQKSFLVSQFEPEYIRIILQDAQNSTRNSINSDTDIFDKAHESLQETLRDLIIKLGYRDVIFTSM